MADSKCNVVLVTNGSRPRLLEQTLRTLYASTEQDQFRLTVVDDGDNPSVRLVFGPKHMQEKCSLVRVSPACRVIGRLKNLGAYWSEKHFGHGDWLYFSDDDVAFLPGWLDKLTGLAKVTEGMRFTLWGGQVHPYHQPIARDEYAMLDGPSWLMRWKTWDKIGPLDAKDEGACRGEDVEFCHRLTRAGGRIGVVHPHVVVHTGLTQTDGKDAPGRDVREKMIPAGVLAE